MHFHKFPHPVNFEFVTARPNRAFKTRRGQYRLETAAFDDEIYQLTIIGPGWESSDSQSGLTPPPVRASSGPGSKGNRSTLAWARDGELTLKHADGRVILRALAGRTVGQNGEASMFEFVREEGDQFYGLGEKFTGLEHSNRTTKFWNTDVWGDFHFEAFINGRPPADPAYVSIPYLIIKRGDTFVGLLLDNPHATFVSTGYKNSIANQLEIAETGGAIHLGCESGQPILYILYGPTLRELTCKLQRLVGTTPLPPAWALGYHQCRWGYQSAADLNNLDQKFREHEIPADGLWLDIDYMRGYRVFTLDAKHFPDPRKALKKLIAAGRKIIPIIDPGVKAEPGYEVYDRGHKARAFCLTPQGQEYHGAVWPGLTVFPDFSLESARRWWASEVADFAALGFAGAWLDMNDPSTGPIENEDMLFDHGTKPHSSYHNQYAFGMAQASRAGFEQAHPGERPFLLCRSGSTGSNRYTAIWTGDNFSNYFHLRGSIATTLNLALSGIPFNAPDMGGFGGDSTPALMTDWFKAGFLFPVFRNHTITGSRDQEPWAFGGRTLKVLRHFIRLRYRLRPYLYQLFAEHERSGDAILRPLFYDFDDTKALALGRIDDQFLVGPSILQAPFVDADATNRKVVLPGSQAWFALHRAKWLRGNERITESADPATTPIYVRDGTILPTARLAPADHSFDAARCDFHVFLNRATHAEIRYVIDDGATTAYQQGHRSEITVSARRRGTKLNLEFSSDSARPDQHFTFTTYDAFTAVTINGHPAKPIPAQGIPLSSAPTKTWQAAN